MYRYFGVSYAVVFVWGIAVLFGLIGLGRLVARMVGGELAGKSGWGLQAVWGMGVFLFAGGTLALFGACGKTGITLLIVAGLAMMVWTTIRDGIPSRAALASAPWAAWPAFALVALLYAGGICWQLNLNTADDYPTYFNFCEKLLATGSFDDPFSWRRLASLGGHTLLQSSVLSHASYLNIQAFEVALCPVILLGLILGFRGGALGRSPLGLFIALIAVTTYIYRVNTASHLTGVVLFLGLFVTLDMVENKDSRRFRLFAVAGLLAAGLCSLRAQYIPAAVGSLGFFWLASWIMDKRPRKAAFVEAGCWGLALFVALLPWMIMSFRSNGSPLFPLFQGGNNMSYNPVTHDESLITRVALPVETIFNRFLLPLILCFLAAPAWPRGMAARAVAVSSVLASLAVAYNINVAPDWITIPRYVQPLLLSGALASLMIAAVSPRRRMMVWALGALLVATSLEERRNGVLNHYGALAKAAGLSLPIRPQIIGDYRRAQFLVPEGKRILVACDNTFLFDHQRNDIWNVDMPNACSPAPGMPFQKPPEEMKRYLRKLGVEYVIFVDFNKASESCNRAAWQNHAVGDVPLLRILAPFSLDFFDTTERLASSETILGRFGILTVMQFKP